MRRDPTPAERLLWSRLRLLRAQGLHFRRQAPIGRYIADFACLSARLVVELDGDQHAQDSIRKRDALRTAWLRTQGFRELRFWNADVTSNLDGVVDTILSELGRPIG